MTSVHRGEYYDRDGRRSRSPPSQRRRRDYDYDDRDRRPGNSRRETEREPYRERERRDSSYREQDSNRERERDRERDRVRDGRGYERDRYRDDRRDDRRAEKDRGKARDPYDRPQQGSSRRSPPRSRSPSRSRSLSNVEDKSRPNFAHSGLLAAATNTVSHRDGTSTVLKYNEPPEARMPTQGWRLYVFKGDEQTELLHIHRQSAYLAGRDALVAEIALDHLSCSKQHAAFQHRQVTERGEYGSNKTVVKPFIIDLDSTNGTFVNGEKIPTSRYYELKASDIIKFGLSSKEYVILHDEAS